MNRRISFGPAIRCIGVASCLGAPFPGCETGPAVLRRAGMVEALAASGRVVAWGDVWPAAVDPLPTLLRDLADRTEGAIRAGARPVVIGGDHAIAAGTWRGVGRGLGGAPGLVWIDAHLDAHTPATTPSGNAHGMPLAALFGLGSEAMTGIRGPSLDPARVALIGVRSYEPEEWTQLAALGVRVFAADEVAMRGLPTIFEEARGRVDGSWWGISLDLDALDPGFAPGVSTPVGGGLRPDDLLPLLRGLMSDPHFAALELAEYNPTRDADGRTGRFVLELAHALTATP